MRTQFFILLPACLIMSCSQNAKTESGKVEIQEVTFTDVEDGAEPPPQGMTSDFTTLEDWLFHICDSKQPEKLIAYYNFGLFESPNENVIFLTGLNKYVSKDSSHTRIEFEPANMYFPLPEKEYAGLTRIRLLNKLTGELKTFTGTDKFKHSFLAKADRILFEPSGEIIWSKTLLQSDRKRRCLTPVSFCLFPSYLLPENN